MAETRTIGIFGAGWVGLVTGGCFAELGHRVIVRDIVPERIEALEAGRLPFHEPDLADVLGSNRERITYTLSADDLADAEILFVCVQTPPTYSGDADLSYVWTALEDIPADDRQRLLVMKSTVPVGTGSSPPGSASSTRSRTCASSSAPTSRPSPRASGSTTGSGRTSSAPALGG